MKKLTALLAALMILLGIFCNGALAASNEYVIKNGVLTAYKGNGGDITIPEGVTEIAANVFRFKHITSITFPSTLKVIGDHAFFGIEGGMASVTIPASVQKIGNGAFRGSSNGPLKEIRVESGSKYFKSVNGVLLSKNGKTLLCYPVGKKDASYTIPGTVQAIAPYSFANTAVKTLVIPASVKTIEASAFYVSDLQELTIPATVKKVFVSAFDYCMDLKKLTIKSDLTEIVDDHGFTVSNKLKIYAPATSPMKKIAKTYRISFKAIGNEEPGISSIKLNKSKATLTRTADQKKPTLQLKATVDPAEIKSPKLKWTSSDKKIAKVDKNGKVTALKAGKVTITCTAADNGEVKATCTVTVKDKAVKSITLDAKKATLKKGKTLQLKVSLIKPQDALNQKIKWTSSDEKVATVDKNGKVTAVGKGTCTITCSLQAGGKAKATVKITVK